MKIGKLSKKVFSFFSHLSNFQFSKRTQGTNCATQRVIKALLNFFKSYSDHRPINCIGEVYTLYNIDYIIQPKLQVPYINRYSRDILDCSRILFQFSKYDMALKCSTGKYTVPIEPVKYHSPTAPSHAEYTGSIHFRLNYYNIGSNTRRSILFCTAGYRRVVIYCDLSQVLCKHHHQK